MRKNNWACFLLILAGIGNLFPSSFLNYGQTFGLAEPLILDLGILCITFGLTIKITVASIIGIVIGIIVYRMI